MKKICTKEGGSARVFRKKIENSPIRENCRQILETIRKTIAEPPFSMDSIPPYKISSKSVENWRRKVCNNSIFENAIQWMNYPKLLQTFLRQFSTELNEISKIFQNWNDNTSNSTIKIYFLFQPPLRNGATSRRLFKLYSVLALRLQRPKLQILD